MDSVKYIVNELTECLREDSWTRNGLTFYSKIDGNFGVINFQKSRANSADLTLFTINLGICSGRLRAFLAGDNTKKPKIYECHWNKRIGNLMSHKNDFWWKITNQTDLSSLKDEILSVLQTLAIPEIKNNLSDQGLIQLWLSGRSEGLTNMERYVYLTTLLKLTNNDIYSKVLEEFKLIGSELNEFMVKYHLRVLGES